MADGMQYMKQLFQWRITDRIFIVTDCLQLPELYTIRKVLAMTMPDWASYVNLIAYGVLLAIGIIFIAGKTTRERLTGRKFTVGFSWEMTILFVWSVLSLSGVSTFLYFNF